MKNRELLEMIKSQGNFVAVEFNNGVADLEAYVESNMRARVVDARIMHDDEEVIKVTFDYTDFDEYNKQFESSNYYNDSGSPILTAREAGLYTLKETVYLMTDYDSPFNLIEENKLYTEFKTSGITSSYVAWLEDKILSGK